MKYELNSTRGKDFVRHILNKDIDYLLNARCILPINKTRDDIEYLCDHVIASLRNDEIVWAWLEIKNSINDDYEIYITDFFLSAFGFKTFLKDIIRVFDRQKYDNVYLFQAIFAGLNFNGAALIIEDGINILKRYSLRGYNIDAIWVPKSVKAINSDCARIPKANWYFESTDIISSEFEDAYYGVSKEAFIAKFKDKVLE